MVAGDGDDPKEGYVRGRSFLHPNLGFTFTAPQGFSLENTQQAVLGATSSGAEALRLDAVRVPATTPYQGGSLSQPRTGHEQAQSASAIGQGLRERLARVVADARDREELQIIEQSIEQSAAELSGLDLREQALVIVAPHAGRVRDLALQLQPGAWVRPWCAGLAQNSPLPAASNR